MNWRGRPAGFRASIRLFLSVCLLATLAWAAASTDCRAFAAEGAPAPAAGSARLYLWVIRDALEDTTRLAILADSARSAGCTDLLIQVRGRGEAYYRSSSEPAPAALENAPPAGIKAGGRPSEISLRYDPLAAAIRLARERGMRVHAWFNVFLAGKWKGNGARNVIVRHPEWKARLADGRSLEELSSAERRRAGVEGIYMSPGNPEVIAYLEGAVRELVLRYDLDGLHLDYIRYPYADAGYDEASRRAYLIDDFGGPIPGQAGGASGAGEGDHAGEADEGSAAGKAGEAGEAGGEWMDHWDRWKMEQVSRAVERIADAARSASPGIEVTAAVIPDPAAARRACSQDWPRWLREGWIDAALLMAYTKSPDRLEKWLREGANEAGASGRIVAGLGLHKIDGRGAAEVFERARRTGSGALALFSHVEFMRSAELRALARRASGRAPSRSDGGE